MGKGKGKAQQGRGAGGWQPRRREQQHRYGDAGWEQEFRKLSDQLRALQLRIKSISGDGNCLFRAVSDQLYGHPNSHAEVRASVCRFIEEHRPDFEPFVEDDVPFDRYIRNMKQDKTWGGNIELQAMSLLFRTNIAIYQLNSPRWDIINFPGGKTIHLSYHDGDHYASVRALGDPDTGVPTVNLEPARTKVVGEEDMPPPAAPAKKKSKKELRLENKAKKQQWNKEKRAAAATATKPSSSSSSSSSSASSSSSSTSSSSSSSSYSSSSSSSSLSSPSSTAASASPSSSSSSSSIMTDPAETKQPSAGPSDSWPQNESFLRAIDDAPPTEAEETVMAATNCSPQVARATLRDLSGDIFQAVEFLLLLAPNERENVTFGSSTCIPKSKEGAPEQGSSEKDKPVEITEADLMHEYNDYSDYGGYPVEADTSWESEDWRDYVKPQHQRQKGGKHRPTETVEHSKPATEPSARGKADDDTPCGRLRILREKRTLTNKERKEKNKLEKEVGHILDKLESDAIEAPPASEERPSVVDVMGTLAI